MGAADLSAAERGQIDQFLSKPLDFPPEFRNWLTDYLAVNPPPIPVSQLLGYRGTLAHNEIYVPEEDGSGGDRTWQDLPTAVSVTGLADGTYFVAWGALTGRGSTGGSHTKIGPSVNGADPTVSAEFQATDPDAMVWRAAVLDVSGANDNNEVSLKYWWDNGGGAVGQFSNRWLTVLRVT